MSFVTSRPHKVLGWYAFEYSCCIIKHDGETTVPIQHCDGTSLEGKVSLSVFLPSTVKTEIKEPCAMSLELPPLVRSGVFLFFYDSQAA